MAKMILDNWLNNHAAGITTKEKVILLLDIKSKLVLVQVQELLNMKPGNYRENETSYINKLYKHYIVNKQPKTYLCNN